MKRRVLTTAIFFIGLGLLGNGFASAPTGAVHWIACAPSSPKTAAALIDRAVWITWDQGQSWSRSALLPQSTEDLDAANIPALADPTTGQPFSRPGLKRLEVSDDPGKRIQSELADPVLRTEDFEPGSDDLEETEIPGTLAVGDRGLWAVSLGDHLWAGGPGPGVRMHRSLTDLQGVVIDRQDRIWAVTQSEVALFDLNATTQRALLRIPITGGRPPVLGPPGATLLVPSPLGLWIVGEDSAGADHTARLHRIGPVDAVAATPGDGDFYVVSRGRLARWVPGGPFHDLGAAPARTTRLLAATGDTARFFVRAGSWLERTAYGWQPVTALSLAIDATGQVWLGTASGPITPLRRGPGPIAWTAADTDFAVVVQGALDQLDSTVGPPPCPGALRHFLPAVRFAAEFGKGASLRGVLPDQELKAQVQTWFYVGLNLSWTLEVTPVASCVQQRRRWYELRSRRAQRLRALWTAWQRTGVTTTADPLEAISDRMERERLAQLIRLQSGVLPRAKEQK